MRKILLAALALCTACIVLAGCSGNQGSAGAASAGNTTGLEPGTYTAKFETDSTMFAINEYYKDEATLEVTDKGATLHAVLRGKGIVKLHVGTAESAGGCAKEVFQSALGNCLGSIFMSATPDATPAPCRAPPSLRRRPCGIADKKCV